MKSEEGGSGLLGQIRLVIWYGRLDKPFNLSQNPTSIVHIQDFYLFFLTSYELGQPISFYPAVHVYDSLCLCELLVNFFSIDFIAI